MAANAETALPRTRRIPFATLIALVLAVVLIVLMARATMVVRIGSAEDIQNTDVFSPDQFAAAEFPGIQANVEQRAVDARELASAIAADKEAAAEQYGVAATVGHVIPVKLTGVAGEVKSGVYDVAVEGLPEEVRVRLQTGPAINGTDLRDATGKIEFGQFTNQIEYQDAGSALNREMKRLVLSQSDTTNLTGKTVTVTGVFKLLNPKNWFVTPVRFSVQ